MNAACSRVWLTDAVRDARTQILRDDDDGACYDESLP